MTNDKIYKLVDDAIKKELDGSLDKIKDVIQDYYGNLCSEGINKRLAILDMAINMFLECDGDDEFESLFFYDGNSYSEEDIEDMGLTLTVNHNREILEKWIAARKNDNWENN